MMRYTNPRLLNLL